MINKQADYFRPELEKTSPKPARAKKNDQNPNQAQNNLKVKLVKKKIMLFIADLLSNFSQL